MPLRFLLYIAREYEKLLNMKAMYKNKLVKIPSPEFFVVYNGNKNCPKEDMLKLSDAFKEPIINLELKVKVININYEENKEFLTKSKILYDYSYFVYLVKNYAIEYGAEYGIIKAINECINADILSTFLKNNGSEVYNMIKAEFDIDKYIEVRVEEELEDALNEGRMEGIKEGRIEGIKEGRIEGIKEGRIEGLKEGRIEGIAQKTEESIIRALSKNLDIDLIADINDVSIEKVLEIKEKINK